MLLADWLSCHNHIKNQDQDDQGMNVTIHTISTSIDVPVSIFVEDTKPATEEDVELQMLKKYITGGWPDLREAVEPGAEQYWPIRHKLTMIDGTVMKGKCIILPCLLQKQILEQLHSNHMVIEKT